MAGLFQGDPQVATSYTTSSTETPKWMQDAIYNQIQWATNTANSPYQSYDLPTVAGMSPLQQQAYEKVQADTGRWAPQLQTATQGTQNLASAPGGAAAANPYFAKQSSTLGGINYAQPGQTLNPFVQQALGTSGVTAAQPYMQKAGQSSVSDINSYMNPYTQNVTDQIAKLGARNLTENLLPGVSDAFVKAGSFGGTRMGEFGSRALRDTQESILGQQSQALQSGYGQALTTSAADKARQASLASTMGGLTQAQQQAIMSGGQALSGAQQQQIAAQQAGAGQYGNMASSAGSLAGADLSRQQGALSQLAQMAQTGQAMSAADTAALEAAGKGVQGQNQAELTAAYQQWQQEQLYPKQQLDWLSTQVRGMAPITPTSTTQSGSSSGATYSPSGLSQLASALSAGAGLYNMAK